MKTAVVTDSTAYLPEKLRKQFNIHLSPLSVIFGHEAYKEEVELSAGEFYERVREDKELPTTSQPPIGMFTELYKKLAEDYEAIVSIHLSSGISGTYHGAVTAGSMAPVIVYPYDTESSCLIQGFYALEAAKMAQEGRGPEEIIARLDELKKSTKGYFIADDLIHLQRGGRLSGAQALIGSLLQVKPILHFENKVIVPFEKVRTKKKAMKRIEELLEEDAKSGEPLRAAIAHANREEEALEWKEKWEKKFPKVEFTISYFGAVIGTHLGEGAMGVGWMKK